MGYAMAFMAGVGVGYMACIIVQLWSELGKCAKHNQG